MGLRAAIDIRAGQDHLVEPPGSTRWCRTRGSTGLSTRRGWRN